MYISNLTKEGIIDLQKSCQKMFSTDKYDKTPFKANTPMESVRLNLRKKTAYYNFDVFLALSTRSKSMHSSKFIKKVFDLILKDKEKLKNINKNYM